MYADDSDFISSSIQKISNYINKRLFFYLNNFPWDTKSKDLTTYTKTLQLYCDEAKKNLGIIMII